MEISVANSMSRTRLSEALLRTLWFGTESLDGDGAAWLSYFVGLAERCKKFVSFRTHVRRSRSGFLCSEAMPHIRENL